MSQILLILLLILAFIAWGVYSFLSPILKAIKQTFGGIPGAGSRRREPFGDKGEGTGGDNAHRTQTPGEEQSSVDLIHETNMDLEGGEYVDYEEVR